MLLPSDPQTPPSGNGALDGGPDSTQEELLSEVAHEFRTPLGVITGYVELLQLRDDPALRSQALPRIDAAAQRLGQAIDRLLSALEHDNGAFAERLLAARSMPVEGARGSGAPSMPQELRTPSDVGVEVRRVLIVDDDDEIRELLLRTLPTDGFEILEARDGHEALALLEREAPHLLLLDWNMPTVSGGDVLEELAHREHQVPVIVLTADDDPARRAAAEAHGVDAFLVKPFSPLELLREIERLLARDQAESFGD
jgi:CheY-like chemotaxis protein